MLVTIYCLERTRGRALDLANWAVAQSQCMQRCKVLYVKYRSMGMQTCSKHLSELLFDVCVCSHAGIATSWEDSKKKLVAAEPVQHMYQQAEPKCDRDWADYHIVPTHLSTSMFQMYQKQLYTDASIVVQGQTLHVHRAVLAASSKVFDCWFGPTWQTGEL